jgi:hypothetical protein
VHNISVADGSAGNLHRVPGIPLAPKTEDALQR